MALPTDGSTLHPSAAIAPGARLGAGVRVGPFCVIGEGVEIGDDTVLESHVVVQGQTRIGPRCHVFPFAVLGHPPQDLKYAGEASRLEIGADNRIREHVTMNPGTEGGGMLTRVGDGCLFMAGSHVAHDCLVGDRVILANNATLAGHVEVGDHVILGGLSAVHQFVRVGAHAFIGGLTGVERDVIPYGMVVGERGWLAGLNLVGLKRRGFDREQIHALRAAFRTLFQEPGEFAPKLAAVRAEHGESPALATLLAFLERDTDRQLLHPREPARDRSPGGDAG